MPKKNTAGCCGCPPPVVTTCAACTPTWPTTLHLTDPLGTTVLTYDASISKWVGCRSFTSTRGDAYPTATNHTDSYGEVSRCRNNFSADLTVTSALRYELRCTGSTVTLDLIWPVCFTDTTGNIIFSEKRPIPMACASYPWQAIAYSAGAGNYFAPSDGRGSGSIAVSSIACNPVAISLANVDLGSDTQGDATPFIYPGYNRTTTRPPITIAP